MKQDAVSMPFLLEFNLVYNIEVMHTYPCTAENGETVCLKVIVNISLLPVMEKVSESERVKGPHSFRKI